MWNSGLVQENANSISYISVERFVCSSSSISDAFLSYALRPSLPRRYPNNNCVAVFGNAGDIINPQDKIAEYLSHASIQALVGQYVDSALFAQTVNKPFIMFETNTASCGGFPGISNAFAGALWSLDYGLQMAYTNFSEALFHVGGQSVVYNVSSFPFFPFLCWYRASR